MATRFFLTLMFSCMDISHATQSLIGIFSGNSANSKLLTARVPQGADLKTKKSEISSLVCPFQNCGSGSTDPDPADPQLISLLDQDPSSSLLFFRDSKNF